MYGRIGDDFYNLTNEQAKAAVANGDKIYDGNGEVIFDGGKWLIDPPALDGAECVLPVITYQLWKEAMEPLKEMMASSMKPALTLLPNSVATKVETPYERFLAALKNIDEIFGEE